MTDTLEHAPPAEKPADRASFRLAVFGAVLVAVLFAGYGIGRLNNSMRDAQNASSAGGAAAAGQHDHGVAPAGPGQTGAGSVGGVSAGGAPAGGTTGGAPAGAAGPGAAGPGGAGPYGAAPAAPDAGAAHDHGALVPAGGAPAAPAGAAVGGLSLSADGLTLIPERTTFTARRAAPLRFRVAGAGGAPVTAYAVVHDKPLHLVVVRRDLTGFQHLHPVMAPNGTWSIDLTLAEPGSYRAIADFTAQVGDRQVPATLGVDLTVAGDYRPAALPAPVRQASTPDGFAVSYEGAPRTDSTQPLLMTVTAPGGGAAKLEPYLGAFGHLVALREGDVAYVHVHPEAQLVDGKVKFWLAAPSPGRYRMFFDFQSGGQVHTAAWTVSVD